MTAEGSPAGSPAIRFDGTSVVYPNGVKGLDAVDLEVPRGELVVVVGLSGAGKSTLLRAVNGLVRITGGDVVVDGRSVRASHGAGLRDLRASVGMIFQDYRLVRRLSVLQNVLVGRVARVPTWRQLAGLWPKEDVALALDSLDRVGLADRAYVKAGQLSGGQQQRVGIARALAQKPAVILADEPVASLDPVTSRQVMDDLQRINRDLGITTLVNLHFLDLAKEYAERIIGLSQGRVVFDGAGAGVTADDFAEIYGRHPTAEDVLEAQVAL
ncbi:MAG: phosphonate ABC transporter ATP-binding protein [Acidobacteriota bacterium]|nr:phosphonate ABC transporter ATP-binding protein [Acidobacteriota bacterium]MDH3525491.1 phosphonate ABC transporter ATP-binding protein [Acidobacteriota bacterium]